MRVFKLIFFVALVLAAVELTFRVYLYGPAALDPRRMDSFNQIHHSGLVRRATNPEIYFELKPDLSDWYKGVRFTTNAAGLRDDSHALQPADDAFRIAVVGSSWTMGSGVELPDIWHQQLERQLSADAGRRVELINFGVDQYGFREIVATLEHKAMTYQPDMVIVAVTHYTPAVLWPAEAIPYVPSPQRHPFFDSHALRVVDLRLGLGWFPPADSTRPRVKEAAQADRQIRETARRLLAIEEQHGVPVVIAKLAYTRAWGRNNVASAGQGLAAYQALDYIDVTDAVVANGIAPEKLQISIWDTHPNAFAHGLIATALREELSTRGLLPGPEAVTQR